MRVCIATFSRSDYTSLRPVLLAAKKDPGIEVRVIAGGSHMLERFGSTIDHVREDCGSIDCVSDFLAESADSDADMARGFSRAVRDCSDYLAGAGIDILFILGDRWEMLAPATAAFLLRIPIIHHSGGDLTQGSLDNQTRFALSTMAHIHLVALEEHGLRLRRMGEEPWRIEVVGEPALVGIEAIATAGIDIRAAVGIAAGKPFVLATHHPTTFDTPAFTDQIAIFLDALAGIDREILLTAPNPDPGSLSFLRAMEKMAASHPRIHLVRNLGRERYYTAMAQAEFMIGNSSSGIWEAPSFGLPVINIGNRQTDRQRGENVLDVPLDVPAILAAVAKVEDVRQRPAVRERRNPYVMIDTVERILNAMKAPRDRQVLLAKKLMDPLKVAPA